MGCGASNQAAADERADTGALPGAQEAAKTLNRARWMTQFGDKIAGHRITDLCIVGAHDAAAYNVVGSRPVGVAPDAPDFIRNVAETAGGPAFKVISDWARTQHRPIFGLLNLGVRYLDIRLSISDDNPKFLWVSHALFSVPFARVVEDIVAFYKNGDYQYFATSDDAAPTAVEFTPAELEANKEVIILDVQAVHGHDGEKGEAINKAFMEAMEPLRKLLTHQGHGSGTQFFKFWMAGARILCLHPNQAMCEGANGAICHRNGNYIYSKWLDAQTVEVIKPKLQEQLVNFEQRHREEANPPIMVTQAVLTSNAQLIVESLLKPDFLAPDSVEDLAGKLNDDAMEVWVNHMAEKDEQGKVKPGNVPIKDGRNVLMIDFCDKGKYEGLDAIEICHWLNVRKFGAVAPLEMPAKPELDLSDSNNSLGLRVFIKTEDLKRTWEAEWGSKESQLTMLPPEQLENSPATEWSLIPVGSTQVDGVERKVVIIRSGIGTFVHLGEGDEKVTVSPKHEADDDEKFVLIPAGDEKPGVLRFRRLGAANMYIGVDGVNSDGVNGIAVADEEGKGGDERTFFKVALVQ